MAEYINKDDVLMDLLSLPKTAKVSTCIKAVEDVKAVNVQPAKNGRWIPDGTEDSDGNMQYTCSNCYAGDKHMPHVKVSYCWNCGADMRGEENDT